MGRIGRVRPALAWAVVASALVGCGSHEDPDEAAAQGCELTDTCGGEVAGEWYAVGETSCVEPPQFEPSDAPCSGLAFHPSERTRVTALNVDRSGMKLASVRLKYTAAGAYAAGFSYLATKTLHLEQDCLPPELPAPACTALAISIQTYLETEGIGTRVRCEEASADCACSYELVQVTGFTGTYTRGGSVIRHLPAADAAEPVEHQYCAAQQRLVVSPAAEQAGLFGLAELRLLRFERLDCGDGKRQGHEEGVDCGAVCGSTCSR